jgi:hypothetical protein
MDPRYYEFDGNQMISKIARMVYHLQNFLPPVISQKVKFNIK